MMNPCNIFSWMNGSDNYYAEEKRTGAITMIFSILAIFIASLGLFGLTLYNSQKRIREIGIRKVMGATETDIITVISKSVVYAVGISILIAMPVAYFMMQDWLRDFPYNVGFQPLLFLMAAIAGDHYCHGDGDHHLPEGGPDQSGHGTALRIISCAPLCMYCQGKKCRYSQSGYRLLFGFSTNTMYFLFYIVSVQSI